jgi:DNA polymerase II small subunit/DNA polymerase delta subunit B
MSEEYMIADINNIVDLVHEENKDLIIEAIESLLKQKIIIPLTN